MVCLKSIFTLLLAGTTAFATPTTTAPAANLTTPGIAMPFSEADDYNLCVVANPGTCTLGLYLSYDSSIMMALAYSHTCELIGTLTGLTWDTEIGFTSEELRAPIFVDPHWEGEASEFWYEGRHYDSGWTFNTLDDDMAWYQRLNFQCED